MKSNGVIDKVLQVNELAWDLYNSNPENEKRHNMNTPHVKTLVSNFEKHQVKYILIGGFAMAFHGHVRATNDIDLWIKSTPENMQNLKKALIDTGITEASALRETSQLVGGFTVFNMLESDFKIDLFHNLKAYKENDFDSCYLRAKISDYQGLKIPVLNAEDLLIEKKNVARKKDAGDISFLERLLGKSRH